MAAASRAETIEVQGCALVVRHIEGPEASEIFLTCRPPRSIAGAGPQAEAAYRAVREVLAAAGSGAVSVSETLFLRSAGGDLAAIREARRATLSRIAAQAAPTEIVQPPLGEGVALEVAVQALVPRPGRSPLRVDFVEGVPACGCSECAGLRGLRVEVGDDVRFYASGIHGGGRDGHEQCLAMFSAAEGLLQRAGMQFRDVARTWIHLRDMARDYDDLNRARRAFFRARAIETPPASTGIGGGPAAEKHVLSLGVYAVKSARGVARTPMSVSTLNEAPSYGSDFARGVKLVESNRVALHVSGTASIDEAGGTAHVGDFDAQVDRMLLNVSGLLARESASFADVVSAVTYVKRAADADRLQRRFRDAGYEGFPHVLVEAEVCRPELLCETEALALLART